MTPIILTLKLAAAGIMAPACASADLPGRPEGSNSTEQLPFHQSWERVTTKDGLPADHVLAIKVFDEQVWVGTVGGLALRERARWTSWRPDDGLPWPAVSAITVAPDTRDAWLGTWGGGLIRLSGGRFDVFDQMNSGLAGNFVFAVEAAGGRVWAATNAGLSAYEPVADEWELYAECRADSPQAAILSMSARGRSLFTAAWCAGVRELVLDEMQWRPVTRSSSEARDPALLRSGSDTTTAVCASDSGVWTVTQDEIRRRDDEGHWQSRPLAISGLKKNFVTCVKATSAEQAWVGTDDGLRILANWGADRWIVYRRGAGVSGGRILTVGNGRILNSREADAALPVDEITCIEIGTGDAWIGTNHGLYHATLMEKSASSVQRDAAHPEARTVGKASDSNVSGRDSRVGQSIAVSQRVEQVPLSTARIGVLGPFTRTIQLPGESKNGPSRWGRVDVSAVRDAVAQAHASMPHDDRPPFELVMEVGGFAKYGWGTAEDDFNLFTSSRPVLGILGHLGPADQILSAVLLRTGIPFVNAAATMPGTTESENPWVFRCSANDPLFHRQVFDHALDLAGGRHIAIVRTPGPAARVHLDWWAGQARRRNCTVVWEHRFDSNADRFEDVASEIARSRPSLVLTWCDAGTTAKLLVALRDAGSLPVLLGSDGIAGDDFARIVGSVSTGPFLAPFPCDHRRRADTHGPRVDDDPNNERAGGTPGRDDVNAAFSRDAAGHLCEAINKAEQNSAKSVRKALVWMSEPAVVRFEDGRWERRALEAGSLHQVKAGARDPRE